MSALQLKITSSGRKRLRKATEAALIEFIESVIVPYSKENIRVYTGRLRSTIRHSDIYNVIGDPNVDIIFGGLEQVPGVVKEIGKPRDVDYAKDLNELTNNIDDIFRGLAEL